MVHILAASLDAVALMGRPMKLQLLGEKGVHASISLRVHKLPNKVAPSFLSRVSQIARPNRPQTE